MQSIIKIPKRINLFVVLTLIVFLTPVVMQLTRNNYVKLMEDAAYMIMLLHSIYIMLLHNKIIIKKSRTMLIFALLLLIFTAVGIYYNGVSLVILQFREFKYLFLLVIMIPYVDKEYFKHVWTVLKIIAAISVPVAVVQWYIYGDEGDRITGLLGYGGSGTLTLFVSIIFFTELGLRLQNNKPILGFYFLYLIPTALNETKITILLLPLLLFSTLLLTKQILSKKFIVLLTITILLLGFWAYTYEKTHSRTLWDVFSYDYLKHYLFSMDWEGDIGRFSKIIYAFQRIKNRNFFFGYGLGASYIGATSGANGYIINLFYTKAMFGGTRPQLFLSLIDQGLCGTILLLFIIMIFFLKVLKAKEPSLERFAAVNAFIVIFTTFVYQHIFYTYQIMYILILYAVLSLKNEVVKQGTL